MPPIYVVQQGARLCIENRRLAVELEGQTLSSTPLSQVSEVVLFGNVGLTTPVIDTMLAQGTPVVFLTQHGDYRGRLVGSPTPHVPLRRAQYARAGEPGFVLALAQAFVTAKLSHQRVLLLRHNRDLNDPDIAAAARQMSDALEAVPRKTGLPALRGVEGAATAAYFGGLRRLLGPEWHFDRRARQPPPDPVNVLLSLGYTLMANTADGAVQAAGLDPYLGVLHDLAYGRPALALDLLEEFRPVVDGLVLWCCRGGQVRPADFAPGPAERPVVLDDGGRRRYLEAYEQRLQLPFTHPVRGLKLPLRQCIFEQARQVAECIRSGLPGYRGMGFR